MEFNYESINNVLYNRHHNLSSYWSSIGWNDTHVSVVYIMEDGGPDETVTIDKKGVISISSRLMKEMESID